MPTECYRPAVMRSARNLLSLALALVALGCSDDEQPLAIPEGCNPVAYEHDCLLPFPSDFFLVADPSLPSGLRVALTEAAQLRDTAGAVGDLTTLHPADGFSPGTQILALFPQGFDDTTLVGATDDLRDSLEDPSPTVLVDTVTGERVLHIAEVDPRASSDERRGLLIRPMERLEDGRRYVVGVRDLVASDTGRLLLAPRVFTRLRDLVDTQDPAITALSHRYEREVFEPLRRAGVGRSSLQLAWDFTVRTRDNATADMLAIREQIIEHYAQHAPVVTVDSVEQTPETHQFRRIEATVEVPLFVDGTEPMAPLVRDNDGVPTATTTTEVPFTVIIPNSVGQRAAGAAPARLMQFGHGFFGDRSEANSFVDQVADQGKMVLVAADWWGMTDADRFPVVDAIIAEPDTAMRFTDRVHQGMANFMAVAYATQGPLVELAEIQIDDDPTYDTSTLYFYGISQGGILGGTYLALTPHIDHAVFSVGGANFSLMMFRARPFAAFLLFIAQLFPDELDQQKFTVLSQLSFDRIDPWTYAPLVIDEPLDGGPVQRQVLMQIGIGDDQVPNIASHAHARVMGLSSLLPAPREIYGLDTVDSPADSALVEFDFGLEPPLAGDQATPASSSNDAHEGVRRLPAAIEQLDRFFAPDGRVEHTCDEICDPE